MSNKWYKKEDSSKVWWYDADDGTDGDFVFSFDKKKKFHLFGDYPEKLTKEEKEIFEKSEPFWADFFKEKGNVKEDSKHHN